MLAPVRAQADLVLDTSAFSAAKLRSTLLTLLGREADGGLHVTVLSFGFKNGLPPEADLVLDVRFLPNPYYVPELKKADRAGFGGARLCDERGGHGGILAASDADGRLFAAPVPTGGSDGAGAGCRLHRRSAPICSCGAPAGGIH